MLEKIDVVEQLRSGVRCKKEFHQVWLLARAGLAGGHGPTLDSSHSNISEPGPSRPEGSESTPGVAKPVQTLVGKGVILSYR